MKRSVFLVVLNKNALFFHETQTIRAKKCILVVAWVVQRQHFQKRTCYIESFRVCPVFKRSAHVFVMIVQLRWIW